MMTDATLQMLVDYHIGLFCWCPQCAWRDVRDADTLSGVRESDYPIPATSRDINCRRCGRIGPEVQPDWPSPVVVVTAIP